MSDLFQVPEEIGSSTNLFDNEAYVAEELFDGERCFFVVGNPANKLRIDLLTNISGKNKQPGKFNNATANLKHLSQLNLFKFIGNSVFDGVIYVPDGNKLDRLEILTCGSVGTAEKLQEKYGKLGYVVFDILKYKGVSLVELPYFERRKYLELAFADIQALDTHIHMSDVVPTNKREFYKYLVDQKGMGVVLKNKDAKYEPGKSPNFLRIRNNKPSTKFNITLSNNWNTIYQNMRYTDYGRKFDFSRYQAVVDLSRASNEKKLKGETK